MRLLLAVSILLALAAIPIVAASDAMLTSENASSAPTQEDLDRAARTYRITVYNTFRRDRAEFDRRNATWRAIEAKWKTDGEKSDELPKLLAWLKRATVASGEKNIRALPRSPEFGLAERPRVRKSPKQIAEAPKPADIPSHDQASPPTAAPAVDPTVPQLPRANATVPPPARTANASGLPEVPLSISPSIPLAPRPAIEEPDLTASTDDIPPRRPAPAEVLEAPAIASLPRRDELTPEPSQPNAEASTPPSDVDGIDADGIDVDEVAIRVAGHNLALATLVEELRNLQNPTIDQLAVLVERLESHAVRAGDLSPYYGLVGESDRDRLRPLSSLDEPRHLLDEKITHAISTITADTTIPETTQTEQLARFTELQRRVSHLGTTTP